ncbi:hypothetical protein [Alkaliphilus peptidifermentans]|uniref:Uncharacterized protein n=1 Tax=Alkaliphilus peptidifermentans DSM 18978 TaxID=1120976 RepID=A0A1G5KPU2_9FIRM|nr:hypothetical protein [Alkaliphilus peptidifermentans]SCZ02374.1 hypothetical protein SAMN03080606_03654 [Alkaliphilus peptidifermentans DSM 18978]
MGWWHHINHHRLRQFEDKNLSNQEYEEVKNRMNPTHTTKLSVIMILKGIFFAITFTALEYVLKNPEITGFLRIALRVGFLGSLVGVLFVPYGFYNLIKSFKLN